MFEFIGKVVVSIIIIDLTLKAVDRTAELARKAYHKIGK